MIEHINNLLSLSDTPRYNIKAVVQQTQVNISTLRAWEQRYGVPHPKRSGHGHRLYSQRDIAIITWLRQCTESGLAISQAIVMLQDGSPAGVAEEAQPPEQPMINSGWLTLRDQLITSLVAVNVRQANVLVNTVCTLFPVETMILELFGPVLVEIGERWANGRACVAEERFATSFIRQRLMAMLQVHAPFARGPRLICACPPGEDHEIGLLMFALLMEQNGWEVIYLGQNVATEGLAAFLERLAPALFCTSVSMVEHVPGLIEICNVVNAISRPMPIVYAGRVFSEYPELGRRVLGTFLGNDLIEAVAKADAFGGQLGSRHNPLATDSYSHRVIQLAMGS